MNCKKTTLVLSGGSFKGFAYIGVIKALKKIDLLKDLNVFVGTSIGSVFAFLLSLNSYIEEIEELITKIDFNNLFNYNIKNLYLNYGLNDGKNITKILKSFLDKKNYNHNLTFKELYDKTKNILIINSTNITNKQNEIFDYLSTPNLKIIKAIRMSISVPFIFSPVKYNNCFYVDGGIIDSFMYLYMINERKVEENKIIGVLLNDKLNNDCSSFTNYLLNVYYSLYSDLFTKINHNKIININVENCNISTFKVKQEDIKKIMDLGYKETIKFYLNK